MESQDEPGHDTRIPRDLPPRSPRNPKEEARGYDVGPAPFAVEEPLGLSHGAEKKRSWHPKREMEQERRGSTPRARAEEESAEKGSENDNDDDDEEKPKEEEKKSERNAREGSRTPEEVTGRRRRSGKRLSHPRPSPPSSMGVTLCLASPFSAPRSMIYAQDPSTMSLRGSGCGRRGRGRGGAPLDVSGKPSAAATTSPVPFSSFPRTSTLPSGELPLFTPFPPSPPPLTVVSYAASPGTTTTTAGAGVVETSFPSLLLLSRPGTSPWGPGGAPFSPSSRAVPKTAPVGGQRRGGGHLAGQSAPGAHEGGGGGGEAEEKDEEDEVEAAAAILLAHQRTTAGGRRRKTGTVRRVGTGSGRGEKKPHAKQTKMQKAGAGEEGVEDLDVLERPLTSLLRNPPPWNRTRWSGEQLEASFFMSRFSPVQRTSSVFFSSSFPLSPFPFPKEEEIDTTATASAEGAEEKEEEAEEARGGDRSTAYHDKEEKQRCRPSRNGGGRESSKSKKGNQRGSRCLDEVYPRLLWEDREAHRTALDQVWKRMKKAEAKIHLEQERGRAWWEATAFHIRLAWLEMVESQHRVELYRTAAEERVQCMERLLHPLLREKGDERRRGGEEENRAPEGGPLRLGDAVAVAASTHAAARPTPLLRPRTTGIMAGAPRSSAAFLTPRTRSQRGAAHTAQKPLPPSRDHLGPPLPSHVSTNVSTASWMPGERKTKPRSQKTHRKPPKEEEEDEEVPKTTTGTAAGEEAVHGWKERKGLKKIAATCLSTPTAAETPFLYARDSDLLRELLQAKEELARLRFERRAPQPPPPLA